MITVPGSKICYRPSDRGGWEWTDDGGERWNLTFRSRQEILDMHRTAVDDSPEVMSTADVERELFGETLDEPIPDDFAEMLGI
jgi:hypothetical protein